jgi:SAM-dependent methyltransferase
MERETNWERYARYYALIQQPLLHRILKALVFDRILGSYGRLLRAVAFERAIEILEFGCGTGYVNLYLSRRFSTRGITAIDKSPAMLDITRSVLARVGCRKSLVHGDFLQVELPCQYDLVHSQGVIEHFSGPLRLELLRRHFLATRPGGWCIVFFPTPSASYRMCRPLLRAAGLWGFHDEVPLKARDVIREMTRVGFALVAIDTVFRYTLTEAGILFRRPSP